MLLLTCNVKNNSAPDSFQLGLVERQILEVLHGLHQTKAHRTENDLSAASRTPSQPVMGQEAGSVCRKVIQAQDVCPICQEELLEKKQPVSYCRCVGGCVWTEVGVSHRYCFSRVMFQDDVRCSTLVALLTRTWPHKSIISPNTAHPAVDIQHVERKPAAQIFGCYKIRLKSPDIPRRGHFIQTWCRQCLFSALYRQIGCPLMCCPRLSQVWLWQ